MFLYEVIGQMTITINGGSNMKDLEKLLKSKDVGVAEGLANLFADAALRGAVTTVVFFLIDSVVFIASKALAKRK